MRQCQDRALLCNELSRGIALLGRSYLILRIAYRQLSSGTTDDIREEDQ